MSARWRDSRKIQERVLVKGKLILETPALLGSGDAEGLADMPLLVDPLEGIALLTGSLPYMPCVIICAGMTKVWRKLSLVARCPTSREAQADNGRAAYRPWHQTIA